MTFFLSVQENLERNESEHGRVVTFANRTCTRATGTIQDSCQPIHRKAHSSFNHVAKQDEVHSHLVRCRAELCLSHKISPTANTMERGDGTSDPDPAVVQAAVQEFIQSGGNGSDNEKGWSSRNVVCCPEIGECCCLLLCCLCKS